MRARKKKVKAPPDGASTDTLAGALRHPNEYIEIDTAADGLAAVTGHINRADLLDRGGRRSLEDLLLRGG